MRDHCVIRAVAVCGLLVGLAVLLGPSAAPPPVLAAEVKHTVVTDAMLLNAAKDTRNWLIYGRDYTNQRYSPLSQISIRNVGSMVPRWVFQTGVIGSFQTVPIVINGVMYLTTPYNHAIAVDASTGRELWRYQHKLGTQIFC